MSDRRTACGERGAWAGVMTNLTLTGCDLALIWSRHAIDRRDFHYNSGGRTALLQGRVPLLIVQLFRGSAAWCCEYMGAAAASHCWHVARQLKAERSAEAGDVRRR
jgi:hypothetical protein